MIRHLALATVFTLAACGSDDATTEPPTTQPPTTEPPTTEPRTTEPPTTEPPTTEPPTTEPPVIEFELPTDPDAVVLQLEVGVNQPDPVAIASGYPIFTLYADGRLIVRDGTVRSGALPPLAIARLSEAGGRELLALAIANGGLDPLDSYGRPNVADADGLGFVVATADQRREFGVYALGSEGDPADDITPDQLAGRDDLRRLRDALLGWEDAVGEHVVESPAPFTGERVMIIAWGEDDALALDLPADLAGGAFYENRVDGVYCVELTVAEWPGLVEALTAQRSFGHRVTFRQVLPHEPGCEIMPDQ